jgi:hypothetical protein
MRAWWRAAAHAADIVASQPDTWLPGALAWSLTLGWLPLVVAVAAPPSVADLTFFGAGIYTSGAWPWNAIVAGIGAALVATAVVVLTALAEAILATIGRRVPTLAEVMRVAAIGIVAAAPAVVAMVAAGTAFVIVALDEFTSPGAADPLLRTIGRLLPFGVALLVAWVAGGLLHAAASRAVVRGGDGVARALVRAPGRLRRTGSPVLLVAIAGLVARALFLVVAVLLLGVLWRSIAVRLAMSGIDAALVPLLVGFVAIWLCLIVGGGALHAWTSLTWTLVLDGHRPRTDGAGRHVHGDPHRP